MLGTRGVHGGRTLGGCVVFANARAFNGDVSSWDVSSVTNMYRSAWRPHPHSQLQDLDAPHPKAHTHIHHGRGCEMAAWQTITVAQPSSVWHVWLMRWAWCAVGMVRGGLCLGCGAVGRWVDAQCSFKQGHSMATCHHGTCRPSPTWNLVRGGPTHIHNCKTRTHRTQKHTHTPRSGV